MRMSLLERISPPRVFGPSDIERMSTSKPTIGLVASGAMGSAVARRLVASGYTVLTALKGRSEGSLLRAREAGMHDVGLSEMVQNSRYILSILPPSNAASFADQVLECLTSETRPSSNNPNRERLLFVDCNAISPHAVTNLSSKFVQHNSTQGTTLINFVDASIIGGPPSAPGSAKVYDPTFYISGEKHLVDDVAAVLREGSLKVTTLDAGIGEASALKMGYAGINKGFTGLIAAMILATYSSSPATAKALMTELASSQPELLRRTTRMIPNMLPKAYRFVGEMQEIAEFASSSLSTSFDDPSGSAEANPSGSGWKTGDTWKGLADLFELVSTSLENDGNPHKILTRFVQDAAELLGNPN